MNETVKINHIPALDFKSSRDHAREMLMGEVIAAATKQLRSADKPWIRLPEHEQRNVLREVERDCAKAVEEAVDIIASDHRTRFRACVESVTFKDGVKAVLQMPNTSYSHELADCAGHQVLVVIEDAKRYTVVGPNAPQADKEQPTLET